MVKKIDDSRNGGGSGPGGFAGNVVRKAKSNPIVSFIVAVVIFGAIYMIATNGA